MVDPRQARRLTLGTLTHRSAPVKEVVIVSACRTPIAKFQGALAGFRAPELGALAVAEAL